MSPDMPEPLSVLSKASWLPKTAVTVKSAACSLMVQEH